MSPPRRREQGGNQAPADAATDDPKPRVFAPAAAQANIPGLGVSILALGPIPPAPTAARRTLCPSSPFCRARTAPGPGVLCSNPAAPWLGPEVGKARGARVHAADQVCLSKAKIFVGVSRKEQPLCIPFASLIHHCHICRGFLFNKQFISNLTNLRLEHLTQIHQRCRGCK